jgi:hypothetical protein
VAVDGADADVGAARHVVHLGVHALVGEHGTGRVEDLLAVTPRVGAKGPVDGDRWHDSECSP